MHASIQAADTHRVSISVAPKLDGMESFPRRSLIWSARRLLSDIPVGEVVLAIEVREIFLEAFAACDILQL